MRGTAKELNRLAALERVAEEAKRVPNLLDGAMLELDRIESDDPDIVSLGRELEDCAEALRAALAGLAPPKEGT